MNRNNQSKGFQEWPTGMPVAPKPDTVHQTKPFIGRGVNPITQYPKKRK